MAIESSTRRKSSQKSSDNERKDSFSQSLNGKMQLATCATIFAEGETKMGTLVLLRGKSDESCALKLLNATHDEVLWEQVLSANSSFECSLNETQQYLLTEVDGHEPVDVSFWDGKSGKELARSISNACLRLAKRANGVPQHRSRPITKLPPSSEEVPSPLLPDAAYLSGQHVKLSPVARRPTLATKFEKAPDERRQKTAPPVMVKNCHSDDDRREQVERWLKATSISSQSTTADTPSIASAPPREVASSNSRITTEIVRAVSYPGSAVHCRSKSLLAARTKPRIHPAGEPRLWTAKIRDKAYQIRDVSLDLTNVRKGRRDSGGFGTIRMGYLYGEKVAIKQMVPSKDHVFSFQEDKTIMAKTKRFRDEAVIAMLLSAKTRHPNIVGFEGIAIREDLGACLVFPWMKNGNSLDYVKKNDVLRYPIIRGALEGLHFLHKRHFVHGDFKAHNVLISDEGVPLIADFGLARHTSFEGEQQSDSLIRAGNPRWEAPELHDPENRGKRTKMSDMWAFGMFAVEILTGELPFSQHSMESEILSDIEKRDLPPRPEYIECSDGLWNVIKCCWEYEPNIRITAKDALRMMNGIGDDGELNIEGSVDGGV